MSKKKSTSIKNVAIKTLTLAWVCMTGPVGATELPPIEQSELFAKTVQGCEEMKAEWKHPTIQVLIERGVKLESVSLCNDKIFPIFYAEVPYDPNFSHNDDYFNPLYRALLNANGQHPFAIIATRDQTIIRVTGNRKFLQKSIERYAE